MRTLVVYQDLVAKAKEISNIDITHARNRRAEVVRVRACVINSLWRNYGMSKKEIGRLMDMDHTTILHHVKHHIHRYHQEAAYSDLYDAICATIIDPSGIMLDEMLETMRSCLRVESVTE